MLEGLHQEFRQTFDLEAFGERLGGLLLQVGFLVQPRAAGAFHAGSGLDELPAAVRPGFEQIFTVQRRHDHIVPFLKPQEGTRLHRGAKTLVAGPVAVQDHRVGFLTSLRIIEVRIRAEEGPVEHGDRVHIARMDCEDQLRPVRAGIDGRVLVGFPVDLK